MLTLIVIALLWIPCAVIANRIMNDLFDRHPEQKGRRGIVIGNYLMGPIGLAASLICLYSEGSDFSEG